MRKLFTCIVLILTLSFVVSVAAAAGPQTPVAKPTKRVFTSLDEYDVAVAIAKAQRRNDTEAMSDEARESRARAIEEAMNRVDHRNQKALEQAAEKLGLLVYIQKPESSDEVGIMSDACCSVSMPAPTTAYDASLDSHYIRGSMRWTSDTNLAKDLPGYGNVGGPDGAGLWFTYMTPYAENNIWRHTFETFRKNGTSTRFGTTPDLGSRRGGDQFALIFSAQDFTSTGTVNGYDLYSAVTYIWFSHDRPRGGRAYMTYAHTWSETHLTNYGFNIGGDCV